jgi:hypothetical protein
MTVKLAFSFFCMKRYDTWDGSGSFVSVETQKQIKLYTNKSILLFFFFIIIIVNNSNKSGYKTTFFIKSRVKK